MEPGKMPSVRLDWAAYFRKFCELHGEPVKHNGRLIFRDGYAYSATDHAGPEYPPPSDPRELLLLRRVYWVKRRRMVQAEMDELKATVRALFEAQSGRSAPLQQTTSFVDDDGKRQVSVGDVDRQALLERMKWLVDDARECNSELRALEAA